MLILTRKPGESLYIGDSVKITIVEIKGHQIRVGIEAPQEMRIYREEIYLQILEENKTAAQSSEVSDAALEGLSISWGDSSEDGSKKKHGLSPLSAVKSTPASPEIILRKKKGRDK